MDKLILSAGYMCDMSWPACVKQVNGVWTFDKKLYWEWLQPLANAGINLHRIALYCVGSSAPRSTLLMPWGFVPDRDAWDMRVKNQPFFDILRQQVVEANKMKLKVMVCVMNECEERKAIYKDGKLIDEGPRRRQSPFFHNVNGFSGLYEDKAMPFIRTLTEWTCEALDGLDYAVELINEGHRRDSGSSDAVNQMIPVLLAHDVKPWNVSMGADVLDVSLKGFRPVGDWPTRWPNEFQPPSDHPNPIQPIGRENYDIFADRLHFIKYYDAKYPKSTHQIFMSICHNFADRADPDFPALFPYGRRTGYTIEAWLDRNLSSNRVCFSTDGTDHADAPSGRPSPERMKAAMLYVMKHNSRYKAMPLIDGLWQKLWFDFLGGGESTENIVKVVDAMAEAHKEMFGTWPENRGNVPPYAEPEPEPQPEPEPEPPTPPIPPIPTNCGVNKWYEHLRRLNFKAAWEHLRGLHK